MQDILKHTDRAGQDCSELQKALHVMQVVPKAANDMMNVGRLCGFDVCYSLFFCNTFLNIQNLKMDSCQPFVRWNNMFCYISTRV